jgi:hypothetical protein
MRVSNLLFASFFFAFALFFSQTSYAANSLDNSFNGCIKTLKSRNGTVMAGGPAKTTFVSTAKDVTIVVTKTGGKAQTIVNIYVNNQKRTDIVFNNGKDTPTKRKIINNVQGKTIRIDIVNQSTANKFQYRLAAAGATNDLGDMQGNLAGQGQKTTNLSSACTNQVRIVIRRTGGNARANVYVRLGNQTIKSEVFDKNQTTMTLNIPNAHNKDYSVLVKNVSVGNWFKFKMDANSI